MQTNKSPTNAVSLCGTKNNVNYRSSSLHNTIERTEVHKHDKFCYRSNYHWIFKMRLDISSEFVIKY